MIRGFYSGASGLIAQQSHLDVVANNMANTGTVGFKPQKANFQTLLYENVNGALPPISTGHGTRIQQVTTNFKAANLQKTDYELDFALVDQDGFFAIETPDEEPKIYYTRAGNFQWLVDGETRTLVTGDGEFVLDADGSHIEIGEDEEIEPGMIGVFDMPNPYGMMPVGGNKYALTEASGEAEVVENLKPVQGYLESSKTDIATEMVRMIEASRAFSMNAKVVTTADEIEQTVNSLR